jgi:uncharacterized protein YndB with AHSA1/START domain
VNKAIFSKDPANKKVYVAREFAAPVDKVWKAWTESELLDKWWAPKPWRMETKTMDFSVGGAWHYAMVSPEGEKHWSQADFTTIDPKNSFSHNGRFTDEYGTKDSNMLSNRWVIVFLPTKTGSKVEVELTFDTTEGFEKLIQMGFEGGFSMGLSNLDELLAEI